jgi:hypothetical protein
VDVPVAIGAKFKLGDREAEKRGIAGETFIGNGIVAFFTFYKSVFTGERKLGGIVIKSRGRFPAFQVVAGKTQQTELAAMFVHVAANAFAAQPQEGALQVFFPGQQGRGIGNILRLVAIAALGFPVSAFQLVAGEGVIEIVDALFPANQFKIPPVMLAVAHAALPVIRAGVKPFWGLDSFLQQRVAGQAFFRGGFCRGTMALGAIGQSFQKGVAFMKFSRGYLRLCIK